MTTPTAEMLEREEVLVEEARELRERLAAHEELDALEDERVEALSDIKALELAIRRCVEEMTRMREASAADHAAMILLYRRADEERKRADEAHERFLERLSAVRAIDGEIREATGEIRGLRRSLREAERQAAGERERMREERRRELTAEARRKLEAGERLTLDELKLLYGEEEDREP